MKMALKNSRCILPCLLFCLSLSLTAADINRDSLARVLKKTPENSRERAEILGQLSVSYSEDVPDEAIFYGEAVISLARKLGAPELLYQGHMSTGVAYAVKGDAPEIALQHFLDALNIAKRGEGKEWLLRQVKSRINISGVHWQLENIGPALAYAYQNVAQLKSMDEPLTLAGAYRTVALIQQTAENYDSTFYYLHLALGIYEAEKASHQEAFTLVTLSTAYQQVGLQEQAQQILYRVQQHARMQQDSLLLRDTYRGLSKAHLQLNRIDSAEYYARALLEVAARLGLLPEMASSYELLSELYTTTNQPDSALHYYRRYAEAREQLISDEKARAIQEMDTRYQAQEKARENRLLREQYTLANSRNTLLLISSLLFLSLVAIIAFFNHRLRRRKTELEQLNEEAILLNSRLMALMNEKKHLIKLIAHDIRNPLSLIQLNTYALAQGEFPGEQERKEMLTEIEQATADIDRASLKIMEVENKAETRIKSQNTTFDLVQALQESIREFTPSARSKSISLQFHAQPAQGFLAGDPFLMQHIIANLLSNAIKYSPPNKIIEVSFHSDNDEIAFTVKDEGPGLSAQEQQQLFQRGKTFHAGLANGERSLGEGLYLTRRYVEAMGGDIFVKSRPGQGASFTARFPKPATT